MFDKFFLYCLSEGELEVYQARSMVMTRTKMKPADSSSSYILSIYQPHTLKHNTFVMVPPNSTIDGWITRQNLLLEGCQKPCEILETIAIWNHQLQITVLPLSQSAALAAKKQFLTFGSNVHTHTPWTHLMNGPVPVPLAPHTASHISGPFKVPEKMGHDSKNN